MILVFFAIVHLILSFYLIPYGLNNVIRNKVVLDYGKVCLLSFGIFYGFVPALYHIGNYFGYEHRWAEIVGYNYKHYLFAFPLIIIASLFFVYGTICAKKINKKAKNENRRDRVEKLNSYHRHDEKIQLKERTIFSLITFAYVILIASIGLYYLYSQAYGGFIQVLALAEEFRNSAIEVDIPNSWSFLKPLGRLSEVSSYLFIGLMSELKLHKIKLDVIKKSLIIVGIIISFLFSIYVILCGAGKLDLLLYIVVIVIYQIYVPNLWLTKPKIHFFKFILVSLVGFIYLFFGDRILYFFQTLAGSEMEVVFVREESYLSSFLQFFIDELSFPFVTYSTVVTANNNGFIEPRFITDLYLGLVKILPESLISTGDLRGVSELSNELVNLPGQVSGVIPIDLISFSIYSFGLWGVALLPWVFGFGVQKLQFLLFSSNEQLICVRTLFLYAIGIQIVFCCIPYADPYIIVRRNFSLIIGYIFLMIFLNLSNNDKIRRRKFAKYH